MEENNIEREVPTNSSQLDYDTLTAKDVITNSSQQMFDNFVNNNFTPEQQEEIRKQISGILEEKNGTCVISWQGEEAGDNVSVTYVNGKMTKFKMSNRDESDDRVVQQKIKYRENKHSAKVFTYGKIKSEGVTNKHKIVVSGKDGSQFNTEEMQSRSQTQLIDYTSISHEKEKIINKTSSTNEGYRGTRSTSQRNIDVGLVQENRYEVNKNSETFYYDSENNQIKRTVNNTKTYVGEKGVVAEVVHGSEKDLEDGTTVYNESRIGISAKNGMVMAETGTTKVIGNEDGDTVLSMKTDTHLGIGRRVSAGVHIEKETKDERVETTLGGTLGLDRASAEFSKHKYNENGETHKIVQADVNLHSVEGRYYTQRLDEDGNNERDLNLKIKRDSRGVSFNYSNKKEVDGFSHERDITASLGASDLKHAGFNYDNRVIENGKEEVRKQIKLDTEKAYSKLEGIAEEALDRVKGVIQGNERKSEETNDTAETSANNCADNSKQDQNISPANMAISIAKQRQI